MKFSWRSPWIWSVVILLTACDHNITQNQTNSPTANAKTAANCPASDEQARRFDVHTTYSLSNAFDFNASAIEANADTVTVTTPNHNLVFCRTTGAWAILPPSKDITATEEDLAKPLDPATPPSFQTLQVAENAYQYRAILSPNPQPNSDNPAKKVIFELIPPNQTTPIALDLYNLEELRAKGIGYELGVPAVKAALSVGDALFFAVSSEQGEGFSGLSTLIRYEPATAKLEILKLPEIIDTQITDLTATTDGENITLWMGTKYSVEGSTLIPAKGLVSYRFPANNWQKGAIAIHSTNNSPLIGAVPSKLYAEDDILWAATGNGICKIKWQQVDEWNAWQCWRFVLEAELPPDGLPLYRSLLANVPRTAVTATPDQKTTEVLWWSSIVPRSMAANQTKKGRFEITYPTGFKATIPEGAFRWDDTTRTTPPPEWDDQVYWLGEEWHWQGNTFTRSFDEVAANAVGLGPAGISERGYSADGVQDTNVLRGDLKLLAINSEKTELEYYSGWVDDNLISPYFTVLPSQKKPIETPNPLKAIAPTLKTLK